MTPRHQPSANTAPQSDNRHYSERAEPLKETMTSHPNTGPDSAAQDMSPEEIQAVIDRILSKDTPASSRGGGSGTGTSHGAAAGAGTSGPASVLGKAQAISRLDDVYTNFDGDQQDLEERHALRRKAGLSLSLIHI